MWRFFGPTICGLESVEGCFYNQLFKERVDIETRGGDGPEFYCLFPNSVVWNDQFQSYCSHCVSLGLQSIGRKKVVIGTLVVGVTQAEMGFKEYFSGHLSVAFYKDYFLFYSSTDKTRC